MPLLSYPPLLLPISYVLLPRGLATLTTTFWHLSPYLDYCRIKSTTIKICCQTREFLFHYLTTSHVVALRNNVC